MGDIGYRKRGETGPLYNPERDFAYITPTLMVTAIENMEAPEKQAIRAELNITEDEIVLAAESLAQAQRDFVNSSDPVQSLDQALARRNFYDLRPVVQHFLFASIGEIFLAAWFKAVREVSNVGEDSPAANDMARFAASVSEFVRKQGAPVYAPDTTADCLRLRVDVLQTRLATMFKEVQRLTEELSAVKNSQASRSFFWSRFFSRRKSLPQDG